MDSVVHIMALSHEFASHCSQIIWILILLLAKSVSKKTTTYYMQGSDCGEGKVLGGATIYSHQTLRGSTTEYYNNNIECRITFKAERDDLKLMLRIVDLDIPDRSYNELCNDALYVYDAKNIMGRPVKQAGGNGGLCGDKIPPIILSTGSYLTLYFRTDSSGPKGRGFKLIITAYSEDFEKYERCSSSHFQCGNTKCIDKELLCDEVDHCGDFTDESTYNGAQCGQIEVDNKNNVNASSADNGFLDKFLSLGVTAAISITVGSVVVFVVCVVCVICCCCRCMRKQPQDGAPTATTATATSVTINNGAPPMHYQDMRTAAALYDHNSANNLNNGMNGMNNGMNGIQYDAAAYHQVAASHGHPSHHGHGHGHGGSSSVVSSYIGRPLVSEHPAHSGGWHVSTAATPQSYRASYEDLRAYSHAGSSVYSHSPAPYPPHQGYMTHQGYYPMQQVPHPGHPAHQGHPGHQGMAYSPFPQRESYSQGSAYSSQPPPSYHRSYTPTSSRSGRSNRSTESSVKYVHEKEKVSLPVNL